MPVLINKETGLAENLPDESGLKAGTHEVPLVDAEGNNYSASLEEAKQYVKQGYSQPNSEQLKDIYEKGKYETTGQQIKTGLEGAASALTFGASSELETGLGIAKKEDILKRQEHNPGSRIFGELGGIGASLATGQGEAAILGKAANAIVPAMEATTLGRVGSAAAKASIENMIFQAGNEHEKLVLGDPATSAESVISNIGLAGIIGGGAGTAFGVAPEVWKASVGSKLDDFLTSIKARAGGLPSELKEASGIHIPPEISAALSGSPENERLLQILNESNTKSGLELQKSLEEFHTNVKNGAAESLGRTLSDVDSIHNTSDYEAGKSLKDGLVTRMKEIVEPITKKYDEFSEQFKATPLSESLKTDMANKVAESISELGLDKSVSDVQLKTMNRFLEVLPKQTTADDLKKLATNLTQEHPYGSDTYRVGKILKNIVNDAHETALQDGMSVGESVSAVTQDVREAGLKNKDYTFSIYEEPIYDEEGEMIGSNPDKIKVVATHPKDGEIGEANFIKENGSLIPDDEAGDSVKVATKHRRKGVATDMYRHAELETGLQVEPSSLQSTLGKKLWDNPKRTFGADAAPLSEAIESAPSELAPNTLMEDYQATKTQYGDVKRLIEDLNDRLHVGKSYGPQSFIDNIKAAAPEDILRRLSPKGDVDLQHVLEKSFPEVAQAVKQSEINKLIKNSLTNGELNTKKLFNNIRKLDPKTKNFMLAPEQVKRIEALEELQSRIPTKMNPSGTARTLDKLWSKTPASASAIAAMLFGHNPIGGYILGSVAQYLSKEVPDAGRLALLKFLGSSADVSGEGLQAATQVIAAVAKSEATLNNGVKNIFGAGGKVIPMPSPKAVKALEEQVKRVANNDPEQQKDMMSIGGATGHYMPDHAAALAMTASKSLQYLASLRPVDKALSPLDSDPVPSSEQRAKYNRALQIAEQPMIILNAVKNGSLVSEDMMHLHMMYPALYTRMNQKMMEQMVDKPKLPYSTKMGVASFMGQPLDSTLTPVSISGIQQSLQMAPGKQMNMPGVNPSATAMKGLEKMPGLNRTPDQARQYHRAK